MADKAILRVEKHTSRRALRGALAHNLRVSNTPNADAGRRGDNVVPKAMNSIDKCMARYDARLGTHKPRKNAIHSFEVVVTGSPEKMAEMTAQERTQYFKDSLKWLCGEFGGSENLVSYVIHNDEKTPHLQAVMIPMKGDKLSYKHYLGGHRNRLSELQTRFADKVGVKHGLTRGLKGSKATHKALREYYRESQNLPHLRAESDRIRSEIAYNESKLGKLKDSMGRAEKEAENRLRGVLTPLVEALHSTIDGIEPERTRKIKHALGVIDEIKPDLPDDVSTKLDEATDKLKPIERPTRRR